MAIITRLSRKSLINTFLSSNNVCLSCNAKYGKHIPPWSYLWTAKQYPKTEEERKEAAKKYNLHPEEYKPYPPETGLGDYPQLPMIGADAKDPFYPYDMPNIKKNYEEPLHINTPIMTEDRYPYGVRKRYSYPLLLTVHLTFMGVMYALYYYVGNKFYWFQPVMAKQYPKPGVTHYTFEPAN